MGVPKGASDHCHGYTHIVCTKCVCLDFPIYLFIFLVAFRLYDLDRDDKISRDELLQVSGLGCYVSYSHCPHCGNKWCWLIRNKILSPLIILATPCHIGSKGTNGICKICIKKGSPERFPWWYEDFVPVLVIGWYFTLTTGSFIPDRLISCI